MTRSILEKEQAVLTAARTLAEARVRFAQEWQLARIRVMSDGAATQAAIEKTKDEVTVLQALLRIAEARLG